MKKKLIVLVLACVLAANALTGCGSKSTDNSKQAVCYAIAPTANSQGLNLTSSQVSDLMYDTIYNFGYISVVTIDGDPEVTAEQSYDFGDDYRKASSIKRKQDAKQNTADLQSYLAAQVANDAEVDYLDGIRIAARTLSSLQGYNSKKIVVIGTGLSTTGVLNFRNNLLSAEPETVVNTLKTKNEIPDLTGISVVWQQMGDVAEPQSDLSATQRKRLIAIWQGIIEDGGGSFTLDTMMGSPVNTDVNYPKVSTVDLPSESPVVFTGEDASNLSENTPLSLTEKQIGFSPDKAAYLDEDKAVATLMPIAEYLKQKTSLRILLVGTTAGDEDTVFTQTLSKARAEAVKTTLTKLGVGESRITTIGLGPTDPWHVAGVGTKSAAAAANRKVVILNAASETAKTLMVQ